ncbi:site-specific DNA-methyltransferase [Streptococcus equinus]|uniref:site-specific DNA-methyltransferase n=1 Tax=Streptococcus equinus TaxID=1335 RepID=UPI0012F97105|nr:site-specific DNA-methyltransferase [Streptococcus equinus]QGX46964.1 site-specific DNA-methyltransferase [Streptococcus equinus]
MPSTFNERPHQNEKEEALEYISKLIDEARKNSDNEAIPKLENLLRLVNGKRYGLVWEEHAELVDEKMKTEIPVFVEDETKKIVENPDSQDYNFLLEGDNLHSLHLLQKTHAGRIDAIYIDPPYNTGNNDFVYNDKFVDKNDTFSHSKWLSFMSKRLKLAKNLLSKSGMIFISIDDNEQAQLKLLCDEIFGEQNFINNITVKLSEPTGVKMTHKEKRLPKLKESVLFYKKGRIQITDIKISKKTWDSEYRILVNNLKYEEIQELKKIMSGDNISDEMIKRGDEIASKMTFDNISSLYPENCSSEEKLKINIKNSYRILRDVATSGSAKKIADKKKKNYKSGAFLIKTNQGKIYLIKSSYNEKSSQPRNKLLFADDYLEVNVGDFWEDIKTTGLGNEGNIDFTNGKKPLKLVKRLLSLHTNKDSLILDFFAGSGTTGHAVEQLNKEDGGNRKYILCTNNENNICEEITYRRLKNIQGDLPHNLKYFKTKFISKDDENLEYTLLNNVKTLIELEHGIDLEESDKATAFTLSEIQNLDLTGIRTVYVRQHSHAMMEKEDLARFKDIELVDVPEYYFAKEMREAGL